jgi:hypothetical protein
MNYTFEKSYCGEFDCVSFRLPNDQMIWATNDEGTFKVTNYKNIPMPRAKKLKKIESDIEEAFSKFTISN